MATVLDRTAKETTAKDWASDQEVRWCPGCGDYAILKAVQKTLAEIRADPDNTVFVSGIGCAARFPYYVESYGFHTIHGRAAAIATGVKLANPELDVWVVSGDGDSLSIGGNHLMHLLRRNVDLVYLLFNNQVYGLTKGQASPTSPVGQVTPSTPTGSLDAPVNAAAFALGSNARFVARVPDVAQGPMVEVLTRAHGHRGTSFVEILQNCIVYNDGAFDAVTNKATAAEHQLWCRHGEPLLFAGGTKGLRLVPERLALEVFSVGEDGLGVEHAMVHDETNPLLAQLLVRLEAPRALGVIHCTEAPTYEAAFEAAGAPPKPDLADLQKLVTGRTTWVID
jgi:2-oxoglutarate/2-oxoacid ferredoxin oxidoreductase subunit beta